jgi:pimeloyl-ACP methyl ester carboxylesterase
MINFNLSYQWIRWRKPGGPPPSLPKGVERLFVQTTGGPIEILYAAPAGATTAAPGTTKRDTTSPLFFVHGGMGSAWVWLEYMQFLSSRGVPCYAVSLRGHGESWHPSFLRMVYGTPKSALADDLVAGIRFAEGREGARVVLCGHSSGGGLSQFVLSEREVGVEGLVLAGAVPGFGSWVLFFLSFFFSSAMSSKCEVPFN